MRKKLLSRVTAILLTVLMVIGTLPQNVYGYYRDKEGTFVFTDSNGKTVIADKSWEDTFPYGTFAFANEELTVNKGGDGVITVYRLGGTIGRATAYITYIPAAAQMDDKTVTYAHALGSKDINIWVEDPLPYAWFQAPGKDPDPMEPNEPVYIQAESPDENGDIRLTPDIGWADTYQWYILTDGYWQPVNGANYNDFLVSEEDFEYYDFRCVYTLGDDSYCTVSAKGERYIRPQQEKYPDENSYVVDWDAPTTFTKLPMNEPDEYSGYWFELVFAEGEWVKEIKVSSINNGVAGSDKFGLFTIEDCDGGTVYDTANKLVFHVVDDTPAAPSKIGFTVTEVVADKAEGSAYLTVKRTGGTQNALTVNYATSDGTAKTGRDYAATTGTIFFYADIDTFVIEVPLINDGIRSDEYKDFNITLSGLLGDGAGVCEVSPDEAVVRLYNSAAGKQEPNLATMLYDSSVVDISSRIIEVIEPIAPVSAETVTGELVPQTDDIGVTITVETGYLQNATDSGISPMSYLYPSTIFKMSRNSVTDVGQSYSGWLDWTSLRGYAGYGETDTQNSYRGENYVYKNPRGGSSNVNIANMSTMYSRFQAQMWWQCGAGGSLFGKDYTYPWINIRKNDNTEYYRVNCNAWSEWNNWLHTSYTVHWYTNGSADTTWGMDSNLAGITLGTTNTDGGKAGQDGISEITNGRLLRRIFNNDLQLKIHTANDSDTAPNGAAVLDPASTAYSSMMPTVKFVGGDGGINSNGKIYVGSNLNIGFGNTTNSAYTFANPGNPNIGTEYAVYLTQADNYGTSKGRATSGYRNPINNYYTLRMLWPGISADSLGYYYTLNVVMTRKQNVNIDLSPSVPRKVINGEAQPEIDNDRVGEAFDAFNESFDPAAPANKGLITIGYSPVGSDSNNPYSKTESTTTILKSQWGASSLPMLTRELENLQWINFNCSPEDRIVYNGNVYPGNAKIYLTVADLSYQNMYFYYYSEEYRSIPSIMNINIVQAAMYLDKDSNGRIDGYVDTATGSFILDESTSDVFIMNLNPYDSFDESILTPVNGGQYYMKITYSITPRYLEPPAGANVDSLRAQIIPALIPSITNQEAYSRLTPEQKTMRYVMTGENRIGKEGSYKNSSDDLIMIGAAATKYAVLDIPLGGDLSPVKQNAAGDGVEWNPQYTGNLLFEFNNPVPIYIEHSLAGDNISIAGEVTATVEGDNTVYTMSPAGKANLNKYLGSFVADTMFTLNIQEQTNKIADYKSGSATGRPIPESVATARYSPYPNTDYLKVQNGPETDDESLDMSESNNEYEEFNVDMGVKLPVAEIGIMDYVTVSLDDKEISISIGIPLGGYSKANGEDGEWKGPKDTNKDNFKKVKDFVDDAWNYGSKFAGRWADDSYKNATDKGQMSSGGFKVDFKLMLGIVIKYNALDNTFYFYKLAITVEAKLEYTYQYRLTPCPIVYLYVKVGLNIKVATGMTVDRDPKEERDENGKIKAVISTETVLKKGQQYTFDTVYKAFNIVFKGKINITSNISNSMKPRGGMMSSEGGTPVTVVMCQTKGNDLDKESSITITALEDTTIYRLARVQEVESDIYWSGVKIAPEIYLEAGAGIGIEILKFEVFVKVKVGCEMTFGAYEKNYNVATGQYEGEYGPFSFDKFSFELGLGFRVVALIFNYEMDLIKYTITYQKGRTPSEWVHSWSALGGAFGGESGLSTNGLGTFSMTDDYGRTSTPGVRITLPGNTSYTQQVYSPADPSMISPMSVNPSDPTVPFELSGYGSSGDAFTLAKGLITGYDYRVVTVGDKNYVIYTLSRDDALNPVDNSMLVMSQLVVTNDILNDRDSYGLVNPVNGGTNPNYIPVDWIKITTDSGAEAIDDKTGDLGFDVWVEGTEIHVAWVSYATASDPKPVVLGEPTSDRPYDDVLGYMDVGNYTEEAFIPEEPDKVEEPEVVEKPDPEDYDAISQAEYAGLNPEQKAKYVQDSETGLWFPVDEYPNYLLAITAYNTYLSKKKAYDDYVIAKGIYDSLLEAYTEWYEYFASLSDYNKYIQSIATNSAQNTEIRVASFNTDGGQKFTTADRITDSSVDSHRYLPKSAGVDDDVLFYATAQHGDTTWLKGQQDKFSVYLKNRFPADTGDSNADEAAQMIQDFRMLYQTGVWELYGKKTILQAVTPGEPGFTISGLTLNDGQIIDSLDVMYDNVSKLYYVAYITSEITRNDGVGFITTRKLHLNTFDPTTKTWGTTKMLVSIVDSDDKRAKSGEYSGGSLTNEYESPYFANLGFLRGKLGSLTNGESIQALAEYGDDTQDFLLFEKNGTTYVIPSADIISLVEDGTGYIYPFFKPTNMVVGEEGGEPIYAPQSSTGRAEIVIGADGAGNISAVYVVGVEGSLNNALYLSKYDAQSNTWGVGTILAMHNMQVYEDSFGMGWTPDELELAYLEGVGNYIPPHTMESFKFSNIQIALGQKSNNTPMPASIANGEQIMSVSAGIQEAAASYGENEPYDVSSYTLNQMGIDPYATNASGSDTLLILTQGSLTKIRKLTEANGMYAPEKAADVGIYAISYGVGGQRIGKDALDFLIYDFGIGSKLYAYLSFENTGDVAIRSGPQNPITVTLNTHEPKVENGTTTYETNKLAEWEIKQTIASGQAVYLDGELVELTKTLPVGTIFYITITEDSKYFDKNTFSASTLIETNGVYTGTFMVEDNPELGFEDFKATPLKIDENGNTVMEIEFMVGNRGTKTADGVYVQFTYENGADANGKPAFTPLDLKGSNLNVGDQEILPVLMAMADIGSANGIFSLRGSDGDSIKPGYGRKVKGTVLVPPSAYEGNDGGSLHLQVEVFSNADTITNNNSGVIEAIHGEYNQYNNKTSVQVEHRAFFNTASHLTLTLGNTLRLPVSVDVTTGNKMSTIIPVEVHDDSDSIKNLGILSYSNGTNINGHVNGTLTIIPSEVGNGTIHLLDLNTSSIHIITYEVIDRDEGINVFKDNGFFKFYNSGETPYNADAPGQSWNFMTSVDTWGVGASQATPMRNDLSLGSVGASFTFTTVAETIDFYCSGEINILKEGSSIPQTVKATGGSDFKTVNFGSNPDNLSFTVTVTVTSQQAWIDKIVEHYSGGITPLPNRDNNAPYVYWSRSFPDEASIKRDVQGNEVYLTCYVLDDSGLGTVSCNDVTRQFEEGSKFIQFDVTVTQDMTNLTIFAQDTAGNKTNQSVKVDWFNTEISSGMINSAPSLETALMLNGNKITDAVVMSGDKLYLQAKVTTPTVTVITGPYPELTEYQAVEKNNDTSWEITDPVTMEAISGSTDTFQSEIPNNGYYRVYVKADNGTWAQAFVRVDNIDSEVPTLSLSKTEVDGSPVLDWNAQKKIGSPAYIVSATINGYTVYLRSNDDQNRRVVSGLLPISYGGSYTLSATDVAGNYNYRGLDVTLPVDLSDDGIISAGEAWLQSRDNGRISVDVSKITGGKYDTVNSDAANNIYVGAYQHVLISEALEITLEELLELPEAAALEPDDDSLAWNEGNFDYNGLTPGMYTLYVRDALDKNNADSAGYLTVEVVDTAVGFTAQTYPTSAAGGVIEIHAFGGKDKAQTYLYAILPTDQLIPIWELADNNADWETGIITPYFEPSAKVYNGLTSGSYQIGVRAILGIDEATYQDYTNSITGLQNARTQLTIIQESIQTEVDNFMWTAGNFLNEWLTNGEDTNGNYTNYIGNDPDILSLAQAWIIAMNDGDEELAETLREAHDNAVAEYARGLVIAAIGQDLTDAEAAVSTAEENYKTKSELIIDLCADVYDNDTSLWGNAYTEMVYIAPLDTSLYSVAGQDIVADGRPGDIFNPKTADITVPFLLTSIWVGEIIAAPGATVELYNDSSYQDRISLSALKVGENHLYIKVIAADGLLATYYDVCVIRVEPKGNPFVDTASITLSIGEEASFIVNLGEGEGKANSAVVISSNPKIATVDGDPLVISLTAPVTLRGVSEGTTDVKVIWNGGPSDSLSQTVSVNVTANPEPDRYTVTFNGNGGTPSVESITVEAGKTIGANLPYAVLAGYTFVGWNYILNGKWIDFNENTIVNGNLTVYAMWSGTEPVRPVIPEDRSNPDEPSNPRTETGQSGSSSPTITTPTSVTINGIAINYIMLKDGSIQLSFTADKLKEIMSKSLKRVFIDLSGVAGSGGVTLPSAMIDLLVEAGLGLEIALPYGKVSFGPEALAGILEKTKNGTITLTVKLVDEDSLTQEQKDAANGRPVYELSVFDGTQYFLSFSGFVEVTLNYTPGENEDRDALLACYLSSFGKLEIMKDSRYDQRSEGLIFTTTHFSLYVVGYNPKYFNDIDGHWARSGIIQAGAKELLSGYPDGSFKPDINVSRADFVQMIYNVLDMQIARETFAYVDVPGDQWYYTAIASAKLEGFLDGLEYADGTFRPNDPITRREMAVILANIATTRKMTTIKAVSVGKFYDYNDIGANYVAAVELAINVGVLNENGMGNNTFSPDSYSTRAQAAAIQSAILSNIYRRD